MSDAGAHTPLVGVLTPLRVALAAWLALAEGLLAVDGNVSWCSSVKMHALENFAGVADLGCNTATPYPRQASRSRLRAKCNIRLVLGAISTVVVRGCREVVVVGCRRKSRESNFDLTLSALA